MEALGASPPVVVDWNTLDRLVRDLHGEANPDYATYNVWEKFNFIYPFVGATANTCSLNLIDPALYKITWYGSPTHSSMGTTFNSINQYGDTDFNPAADSGVSPQIAPGNCHLSFYNPVEIATGGVWVDMGMAESGGKWFLLCIDDGYDDAYAAGDNYTKVSYVNTGAKNVYAIGTSQSHTMRKAFHNGVLKASSTIDTTGHVFPTKNMFLGATNWISGATNFSGRTCAFATCGAALTDAEIIFLDTAHNAFQVALGRK